MSDTIKQEDLIEKEVVAPTSEETHTEQDPLKVELERVQRTGKTEVEKAAFSLKKNAERAKELGLDVDEVLGLNRTKSVSPDSDDDTPLTRADLKKFQQETASKNALQLADEINNESERELTKFHLENSIKSTGNPSEDLKLARAITNAARNSQVIEEMSRKGDVRTHSNGSGAPGKQEIVQGELTPAEMEFTKKPFNLTKDQILKLRK